MAKKESKPQQEATRSTEELILNYQLDKYCAIPLASIWAKELRRREENRHLTANELLEMALREVLSGNVDWKSLKKVAASVLAASDSAPDQAALSEEKPKKAKAL